MKGGWFAGRKQKRRPVTSKESSLEQSDKNPGKSTRTKSKSKQEDNSIKQQASLQDDYFVRKNPTPVHLPHKSTSVVHFEDEKGESIIQGAGTSKKLNTSLLLSGLSSTLVSSPRADLEFDDDLSESESSGHSLGGSSDESIIPEGEFDC